MSVQICLGNSKLFQVAQAFGAIYSQRCHCIMQITTQPHLFISCLERANDIPQRTGNFVMYLLIQHSFFFLKFEEHSALVNNLLNQTAALNETLDPSQQGVCSVC